MKTRARFLALLLPLLSPCVFAQSVPLDRAEILGRLTQGYSPSYLAQLVTTRGINFSPSTEFLDRVKLAGGDGILVERLSSAPSPPGASASQSDRPFELLAKCAELIHIGAAEHAENDCRSAIQENPESPWPIMAAIRSLAVNGISTQEHAALLRRALSLDPNLVIAHMALATADIPVEERGREIQTVAAFAQGPAAEDFSSPGAFAAYVPYRGTSDPANLTPEAQSSIKAQIQSELQQHPDLALTHLNVALEFGLLGDLENVRDQFQEALRLEPGNPDLHIALATFHLSQHDTSSELAEYREAVRIAPYDNAPRRYLAEALVREKRPDEAIREWQDFLVLSTRDLAASSSLVNLYLQQNDRTSAIAELRRSLKASSDSAANEMDFVNARLRDLDRLAHLLTDTRQFEAATQQYAYLLRFKPDDSVLHNNLGNVLYAQRRCDEASEQYREALRLQPDLPDAHHNLANCLLVTRKTDDAIAEYRQTLELDPDRLESRSMLGTAYVQKGELNSAIEQFQQVLEEEPENAAALVSLGHACYMNKDLPSAVTAFKRALSLKPGFPAAENELAWLYATASDPNFRNSAEALTLARHAVQTSPQPVPEILDTFAEALLLNGQSAEALKIEEQAATLAPGNSGIQSRLPRFRHAAQQSANPPAPRP
jgi:tetratricopeptide (TPR) repeat protein